MNVNKIAISNHTALKLDVQALKNYLSLICEYELYTLSNKKVSTAKYPIWVRVNELQIQWNSFSLTLHVPDDFGGMLKGVQGDIRSKVLAVLSTIK